MSYTSADDGVLISEAGITPFIDLLFEVDFDAAMTLSYFVEP